MKKYLATSLLALLIIPSIAFASWWNPFSWFNNWNFNKAKTTSVEQEYIKKVEDSGVKEKVNIDQSKSDTEKSILPSKIKEVDNTFLNNKKVVAKQENIEPSPINTLEGARISTNKLNYTHGENIVVNIELPEDKFSTCQFALIDPKGNNIALGEGGCVAGIRTDFDPRYMPEPVDGYVRKGEVMSFASTNISNGFEYGRLGDNFGIWTLRILAEKSSGTRHLLETKFDYEKDSSMFKQVVLNNLVPIERKVVREELVKFDGSNGMFTAQSYGLNSINIYARLKGTNDMEHGYLFGSMILKNKDSNGLQTWTLSAYIKVGNDAPIKLITYPAGTDIFAVGSAGYGEDKHEVGKIYYPYNEKEDIDKYLY